MSWCLQPHGMCFHQLFNLTRPAMLRCLQLQGMLSTMLATMQNPAVLGVAALHSAFTHLYLYGIGVRGRINCCSATTHCI